MMGLSFQIAPSGRVNRIMFSLSIAPPLYSEWWFPAITALVMIGTTILVVMKVQQIHFEKRITIKDMERQSAIDRERLRISRDMHDGIGSSLTRLSILSELARQQQGEPAKAQQIINQISEISGGVVDELREIIWAMNPRNDTLDSFTSYNRQYASSYLESAGINGSFKFPSEVPIRPMSYEVRRNMFLAVKEALHNVVKHSGASNVFMQLDFREQVLQITIRDDGNGFVNEKGTGRGNGLMNMHKRMEESKGRFELTSAAGIGTKIELSVKLPFND